MPCPFPPCLSSPVHPEEGAPEAPRPRCLRWHHRLLLSSVSGLHQRAQPRWLHSGYGPPPQRLPPLLLGRVCTGASPGSAGETAPALEGGEAGSPAMEGRETRAWASFSSPGREGAGPPGWEPGCSLYIWGRRPLGPVLLGQGLSPALSAEWGVGGPVCCRGWGHGAGSCLGAGGARSIAGRAGIWS